MGNFNEQTIKDKNGEVFVLRGAREEDADKLNNLTQEVDRIRKFKEDDGDILLVVECGEELVGMLDFQSRKKRKVEHKGAFGISVRSSWRARVTWSQVAQRKIFGRTLHEPEG